MIGDSTGKADVDAKLQAASANWHGFVTGLAVTAAPS